MFTRYLELGGAEVSNSARLYAYAQDSDCARGFVKEPYCEPGWEAIGEPEPFGRAAIRRAPWYDPDRPDLSRAFLGFGATNIAGIDGSTWNAEITEGMLSGGTIGLGRYAARQVRVTGTLIAENEEALEYGDSWLQGSLAPGSCSSHGGSCGLQDLCFFAACPRERESGESVAEYEAYVDGLLRVIHDVKLISGPIPLEEGRLGPGVVYRRIEFTVGCADPHVYTKQIEPGLTTTESFFLLESPVNLVPHPSAELAAAAPAVVARNQVVNPSFETNTTGWVLFGAAVSGSDPTPYRTSGRSTTVAAQGAASAYCRILGNGSTEASGRSSLYARSADADRPNISAVPTGGSVSVTAWASLLSLTVGTLHLLRMTVKFFAGTTAGETPIATQTYNAPAGEFDGYSWNISTVKPAGANYVEVAVYAEVSWTSSATAANNSDIRLYVDAVAVTIP